MKIGIFTDSHYSSQKVTCSNRYNSKSLQKIKEAYAYFKSQNCGLVICLGDIIDKENDHIKEIENLKSVAKVIQNSNIKTICLMGNHDAFCFDTDEFYSILGTCRPENISEHDSLLIFCDACYFHTGEHYKPGDSDWTDTFYPHAEQLKECIARQDKNIYIFMHQNIDPSVPQTHCLSNADELRRIFEDSGKVKAVYQGHFHSGNTSEVNGIKYVTLPAMCERERAYFTIEV